MPRFGKKSQDNLDTCHPDLQKLLNEVIKGFDCSVLCGHRGKDEQNEAFRLNQSTLQWPDSKHNDAISTAVDVVPYPIDWENLKRFYMFGGYVLGIAEQMGIDIRWGGDWDQDTFIKDQNFNDLPHFELVIKKKE